MAILNFPPSDQMTITKGMCHFKKQKCHLATALKRNHKNVRLLTISLVPFNRVTKTAESWPMRNKNI